MRDPQCLSFQKLKEMVLSTQASGGGAFDVSGADEISEGLMEDI